MAADIENKPISRVYASKKANMTIPFSIKVTRFILKFLNQISTRLSIKLATKLFVTPRKPAFKRYDLEKSRIADQQTLYYKDKAIVVSTWGKGTPVLMMHGWEGNWTSFKYFIDPLTSNGFKVVAVDAPAHGHSPGHDTDLTEFVGTLKTVMDKFGPFYAVVAHSFGGLTTLLSIKNAFSVEKLVLIGSVANPYTALHSFGLVLDLPDEVLEGVRINVERRVSAPFDDFVPDLSRLAPIKTLLLHDEQDYVVPYKESLALKEKMPGAHLVTTVGLGHSKILKEPKVIDQVQTFLMHAT